MRLVPFEKYTLTTPLSIEEVRNRLIPIVKTKWSFSLRRSHSPYVGKIGPEKFTIYSNTNRNAFLPRIKGRMISEPGAGAMRKTQIHIVMRPAIAVTVCLVLFLGVLGIPGLFWILTHSQNEPLSDTIFIPCVMVFGYGLITYTFRAEIPNSKKFLTKLFNADPVAED